MHLPSNHRSAGEPVLHGSQYCKQAACDECVCRSCHRAAASGWRGPSLPLPLSRTTTTVQSDRRCVCLLMRTAWAAQGGRGVYVHTPLPPVGYPVVHMQCVRVLQGGMRGVCIARICNVAVADPARSSHRRQVRRHSRDVHMLYIWCIYATCTPLPVRYTLGVYMAYPTGRGVCI